MEKYLLLIDLDGTLLKSADGTISKENKKALERFINNGNVVCISTGRPWRSTKKIYELLNLNTIVSNLNGAHIHHPNDYLFQQTIETININDVFYVLGDKKIEEIKNNLAFEGLNWISIEKKNQLLEQIFGFDKCSKVQIGIDIKKFPLKPINVVIDTKEDISNEKTEKCYNYLRKKYGDLFEFGFWSKGYGHTPIIDFCKAGVSKGKSASLLLRYYGIKLENTISIGDGLNDLEMLKKTEISVAMSNAEEKLKKVATYITKKSNVESGVAEFIDKFLDDPNFVKEQRKIRKNLDS